MKAIVPKNPKLRVMGIFGCTHKTIALGIPLINAMYGKNSKVGLYSLPILIWHPMALVVGTLISPKLRGFIASEQKRLCLDKSDKPLIPVESSTCSDDNDLEESEEGRSIKITNETSS